MEHHRVAFALKERPVTGEIPAGYFDLVIDDQTIGSLWIAGEDHFSPHSPSRPPSLSSSEWDLIVPYRQDFRPGGWKLAFNKVIPQLDIHEIHLNDSGDAALFVMHRSGGSNLLPGIYQILDENSDPLAEFNVRSEERFCGLPADAIGITTSDETVIEIVRTVISTYFAGTWQIRHLEYKNL